MGRNLKAQDHLSARSKYQANKRAHRGWVEAVGYTGGQAQSVGGGDVEPGDGSHLLEITHCSILPVSRVVDSDCCVCAFFCIIKGFLSPKIMKI